MSGLAIVTATIDLARAMGCLRSWWTLSNGFPSTYVVLQGGESNPLGWGKPILTGPDADNFQVYYTPEILGVVPAFALGVQQALKDGAEIIACLHDDLEIEQPGWDQEVTRLFHTYPRAGLLGFGGAAGLGESTIYQTPYNPMQLARQDFISNMRHAEAHGRRVAEARRVACLDGFSQVGRREFWQAHDANPARPEAHAACNLFELMRRWGLVHHAYDAALGCFAKRLGWEVWMLPVRVHHHGGLTAVADPRYLNWALEYFHAPDWTGTKEVQGDAALWTEAHRITYEQFRDCLPIRT